MKLTVGDDYSHYPWRNVKCARCGKFMECAEITREYLLREEHLCRRCDNEIECNGEIGQLRDTDNE